MAAEVLVKLSGTWTHYQDDHMPPFFDAVGATDVEKQYMLTSTPRLTIGVEGDIVHICNIPHPEKHPDIKADVSTKLDTDFEIEPHGHVLQVSLHLEGEQLVQKMTPVMSPMLPHVIEHFLDNNGKLVQVYKVTDPGGKEVKGTRRYMKEMS